MGASLGLLADGNNISTWMPQSGTFEEILLLLASSIEEQDVSLAALLKEIGENTFGSLAEVEPSSMMLLLKSAENVLYRTILPNFLEYYGIAFEFCQLLALLRLDTRTPKETYLSNITIDDDTIWQSERWIFEIVIVGIATNLISWYQLPNDAKEILRCLIEGKVNAFSFKEVNLNFYCKTSEIVKWLSIYFEDKNKGRVMYSNLANPFISESVSELYDKFLNDPRSAKCQ